MAARKTKRFDRAARSKRGGDKGGSKKRGTRGEALEKRLDQVERWRSYGVPTPTIVARCAEQWQLSERQAKEYIAKVEQRWADEAEPTRARARRAQIRRLKSIALTALEKRSLLAAIAAENLLTKVEGTAYQPRDDLPTTGDGTTVEFVLEDPELLGDDDEPEAAA